MKKNTKIVLNDNEMAKVTPAIIDDTSIVVYVNSFTEESSKQFYTDFNKALKNKQTVIPILIDSYGGNVDSLLFMMDLIESSHIPVATFAIGKAMSCGSILLTAGTKGLRFVAPTARVMIHHVSSVTWGKQQDVQVDANELKRLQEIVFHKMAKNCGKKKSYFLDQLNKRGNTDWYLTGEECKKHGLVDNVRVPTFTTTIVIQNEIS